MSNINRPYLNDWHYYGADHVKLVYSDDKIIFVTRKDFDRAFGAIINAAKEDVKRDFAIEM